MLQVQIRVWYSVCSLLMQSVVWVQVQVHVHFSSDLSYIRV